MCSILASVSYVVERIHQYGSYVFCALLLFPWVLLALWLPSMIRRGGREGRQINRFVTRFNRIERGCCPDCGYDLRGSRRRCPECGHPIPWDQFDAAR